ncbi:MAG: hypothetical protein OXU20_17585 [Myxococcales bacterium]|nr:hypothetical protein [Myxococcales bacterium]
MRTTLWVGPLVLAATAVIAIQPPAAFATGVAYGAAPRPQQAKRGVAEVTHCPDGGIVAVGDSTQRHIYAVRSSMALTIWERRYHVHRWGVPANEAESIGESIVELSDGTGFVIAGTTRSAPGGRDAFLLKIDCKGDPEWVQIYGTSEDEGAYDLMETRVSDSAGRAGAWGLIVSGFATSQYGQGGAGGSRHGLLFRTDSVGVLQQDYVYPTLHGPSELVGLTQGVSNGIDDVVAVGVLRGDEGRSAYVLQVQANSLLPVAGGTCAYPGLGLARFNAAVALSAVGPSDPGSWVLTGGTRPGANAPGQAYLVRTSAHPCVPVLQATFGQQGRTARAHDVQRTDALAGSHFAGDVVVTGFAQQGGGASDLDAFLMRLDAATMVPSFRRLYGGRGHEVGRSLAVLDDGFAIAGRTTTDWGADMDLQDLYLVGTDADGISGPRCQSDWHVEPRYLDPHPRPVHVYRTPVLERIRPDIEDLELADTLVPTCP